MTIASLEKPIQKPTLAPLEQQTNGWLAKQLDDVATLLEAQKANPFRIDAYHRAAATLRQLAKPAAQILREEGLVGLIKLPTIGESIARALRTLINTGHLPLLERLRGQSDPEKLLMSIPGIGRKTAEHLHDELGIESLEQLDHLMHDLANNAEKLHELGLGKKRLEGIRDTLAVRLGHTEQTQLTPFLEVPPVAELLDIDTEYRQKAKAGVLPTIAPKRFNPRAEAWLPVLHTERAKRHYTALFSNTAKAHDWGKTRDWVVIYSDAEGHEQLYTLITAQFGPLKGKRIVRGREAECQRYYWPENW